jgi:replicative DNA helicase
MAIDKMNEKLVNIQAEQSVLGAIFVDNSLVEDMLISLEKDDFSNTEHKNIFEVMKKITDSGKKIDYITVIEELKSTKNIDEEGIDYIFKLAEALPTTANFKQYIGIVRENSRKRSFLKTTETITKNIEKYPADEIYSYITEQFAKKVNYEDITYDNFDNEDYLSYLKEDDSQSLIGSGKSAFALNLANQYSKQGYHITYLSLEMNKNSLKNRLFANLSSVENRTIKKKMLNSKEETQLKEAVKEAKDYNLNIYDKSMTVEHLCNYCKKLKQQDKLDILFIDHILLMGTQKQIKNDVERISYITWKLKTLAMELEIPIFQLTQLNRENAREGKAPTMRNLKGSSATEENSNAIILLYNRKEEGSTWENDFVDVIIAKNRDGEIGTINYKFKKPFQRFVESYYNKEMRKFVEVPLNTVYYKNRNKNNNKKTKVAETSRIISDDELPF